MEKLIDSLWNFSKEQWNSKIGLLASGGLILLAWYITFTEFKFTKITLDSCFLLILAFVILFTTWYYTNKLPKTKAGKLGIVISIETKDLSYFERIQFDFINEIQQQAGRNPDLQFTFIVLPQSHARRIKTQEIASDYLRKTKGHFMIWGTARISTINGKENHVFYINGNVRHEAISREVSLPFSREFGEVLPRKLRMLTDNDILHFEFVAEIYALVATYIIGVAFALTRHTAIARTLYLTAQSYIATLETKSHVTDGNLPPQIQKLKNRIPERIDETHYIDYRINSIRFRQTRDDQFLDAMKFSLDQKLNSPLPNDYNDYLANAIYYFCKGDVGSAIREAKRCREINTRSNAHDLSLAFLYAYRGDIQQSIIRYRAAERGDIYPTTTIDVENFILWVLESEPDRYQLHLCLGIINQIFKGDYSRALEEYEAFLENSKDAEDKRLRIGVSYAKKAMSEINNILSKPNN